MSAPKKQRTDGAASTPPLLKVRTITAGITLCRGEPIEARLDKIRRAAKFVETASARFTFAGFDVQTTRLSTNSFVEWCDVEDAAGTLEAFRTIDQELVSLGVGLFNAGPATSAAALLLVPDIISLGPRVSCSGALVDPLDAEGAARLADTIISIAACTAGGEGNFQFCASFNVPPGIPFFPAAYHAGPPSFAIGCETSAILAMALPCAGGNLTKARALVTSSFEAQMAPLELIAKELRWARLSL